MGRRPVGRKYAKHISIQVKEEHNEDFKYLAEKLSRTSLIPNGKKWTIRDIILTLLYTQYNNSPDWFTKHHFEQLTDVKLNNIRREIRSTGDDQEEAQIARETKIKIETGEKTKIKNASPTKLSKPKPKLQVKLDSEYQNYMDRIRSIKQEDGSH